jgi:hypothetical protein
MVRLRLEELEPRELPSASWVVETFDTTQSRQLPSGWTQWSGGAGSSFQVTDGAGFGSNNGLVSTGAASVAARTWMTRTYEKDIQVQADVFVNSLVPVQIFARGRDLDTSSPTYYAVSVTRGTELTLERVVHGKVTILATLASADWVSSEWLRVNLTVQGDRLKVSVFRTGRAQYLSTDGTWQTTPTNAIDVKDSAITSAGRVGIARPSTMAGQVAVDNFQTNTSIGSSAFSVLDNENFSSHLVRGIPSDWSAYTNTTGQQFQVSASASAPTGSSVMGVTGNTGLVARTWYDNTLPADVQVSASLYLGSLAPAQVFARGQNLDTDSPDYYAVSVTRGATIQLVRVLDGRTTVLGNITTDTWVGQNWIQVTLSVTGTTLKVQIYRTDTGQYLTANGLWQVAPTWAIVKSDSTIRGSGKAGVGRWSGASGTVLFDNFFVVSAAGSSSSTSSGSTSPGQGKALLFNFDTNRLGSLPTGWTGWTSDGGAFLVTAQTPPSVRNALSSTGASDSAARAWYTGQSYGDMLFNGSIYVDSLVPAQLIARGQNLSSNRPSYYAVSITRGMQVQLLKVVGGQTTVLDTVTTGTFTSNLWVTTSFRLVASTLQVYVYRPDTKQYLGSDGHWHDQTIAAITTSDGTLRAAGAAGVNRPASYKGRVLFDDLAFVDLTENVPTIPVGDQPPPSTTPGGPSAGPTGIQHYSYIRVAELAYYGTPIGDLEQHLLKNSVDLVVANPVYLDQIAAASPKTTRLIYSNVSNIYLGLLTDWNTFADQNGFDRESAFYHVTKATPFSGNSSSSMPVDWFWSVQRGNNSEGWTDFTSTAQQNAQNFAFGNSGESVVIGYPEKFREINFSLQQGGSDGWSGVVEYASSVDANGKPTGWTTLKTISNSTSDFRASGTITFDPPADWKTASVNGSDRLYYVRVRTVNDGTPPIAGTVLGRDYVHANGGTSGVIPAFDYSADLNHDGYLDNAEYARRKSGMDARFAYEGRAFYAAYGQMRFATNPSNAAYRAWAADYANRYLSQYPNADGLFEDNSFGRLQAAASGIKESLTNYSADYGSLLAAIQTKIGGRMILANTAGAGKSANSIVTNGVSYLEEFALRPMTHNWSQFEDTAGLVRNRLSLSGGKGYAILDTYPAGGAPTDSRTEIAALAYYYLLADPKHTFVMFNGGFEPATTWSRHFTAAVNYNVGQPIGTWSVFATGVDPANRNLTYKVYQRQYENALVLYKPLSYATGARAGSTSDATATTHALGGTYRKLNADGSFGPPITSIKLRNGEGAILVKV